MRDLAGCSFVVPLNNERRRLFCVWFCVCLFSNIHFVRVLDHVSVVRFRCSFFVFGFGFVFVVALLLLMLFAFWTPNP